MNDLNVSLSTTSISSPPTYTTIPHIYTNPVSKSVHYQRNGSPFRFCTSGPNISLINSLLSMHSSAPGVTYFSLKSCVICFFLCALASHHSRHSHTHTHPEADASRPVATDTRRLRTSKQTFKPPSLNLNHPHQIRLAL